MPNATETARAVLYRRVSTDDQGLGLAAQRERLEAEAARRGRGSVEEVTDEEVSGSAGAPACRRSAPTNSRRPVEWLPRLPP